MNKRRIRDCICLLGALMFSPIYLIHILLTFFNGGVEKRLEMLIVWLHV